MAAVPTTLFLNERNPTDFSSNSTMASVRAGRQGLVHLSGERLGSEAQNKIVFVNLIVCCWLSVFLPVRWQAATRLERAKNPGLSCSEFTWLCVSGVFCEHQCR